MSEFASVDRLSQIVSKIPNARTPDLDWHVQDEAQKRIKKAETNRVVDLSGVNEKFAGVKREISLDQSQVDKNLSDLILEAKRDNADSAREALGIWDNLKPLAVEQFGVSPESENPQMDGVVAVDKIIKKHDLTQKRHEALAGSVIDHMKLDATDEDVDHKLVDLIDLDWQKYADAAGIKDEPVSVSQLKRDPAFQQFRNDLVKRVQELANGSSVDIKNDIKKPGKLIKNIWNNLKIGTKIGFTGEERADFNIDLNNARALTAEQATLPPTSTLEAAQEYRSNFAKFLKSANVALDLKDVRDAMPAYARKISEKHGIKLEEEAQARQSLRARRLEAVRTGREKQQAEAELAAEQSRLKAQELLNAELAKAQERSARMELTDLSITAKNFSETSEKQRQIATKALVAIAEKNFADKASSEFAAKIAAGKLPQELENLVHGDVGAEVDLFIKSGGKKGNIQSVQTFFKDLGLLATRADQIEDGLPTTFMPLNTIENETIDPSTGETTKRRSVETGLLVGLSEEGSWELRLSTRENGKINPEKIGPVLRLEPENILVSINNVLDQQNAVEEAQNLVREFEAATKFKGGTKEGREQAKRKLASANKSLTAYQAALMAAKGELASQLSTTGADRTFGGENGVFAEITKGQSQIAEQIFNEDFIESVKQLSVEFNVPASEVTVDALAALSASAEHGHIVASDMAEYFGKMSNPGQLQAEVLSKHEEDIKDMAERFAVLQKDEAEAEGITSETAREAAKKDLRKQRKELEKSATLFGEKINNAFIAAIPEALREGSRSIPMTKTEFNKAVNYALKNTGFNPKDFGAVAAKGPNKGMTTAQVVRTGFSFDAEVMQMADAATDALRVMRNSEAAQTLLSAIDGGDIDGFLKEANAILEKTAAEKLSAIQLEEDRVKLAELLRTPDGMAKLIYDNEINWDEALPLLDEGSLNPEELEKSLLSLEAGELRDKAIKEAARRMQSNVMRFVNEKGFLPPEESHDDALNGNPSLAAEARFAAKYASPDARPLLESFANRLAMEKKTNPSA